MFTILEWLLLIVEVLCCFLLVIVILLQKSRSEGLGMAFGASMGESLFGARATNVLTKITIWLGGIFLVTTTLLAILYAHRSGMTPVLDTGAPLEEPAGALPLGPSQAPAGGALPGPAVPAASFPAAAPLPDAAPAPTPAPLALPADTAPAAPAMPVAPLPDQP
jgi:preprotein translocase subunit SecG